MNEWDATVVTDMENSWGPNGRDSGEAKERGIGDGEADSWHGWPRSIRMRQGNLHAETKKQPKKRGRSEAGTDGRGEINTCQL
jgi:hypothetical protein